MDWCRQYHGEVCDPRYLGIARQVGGAITPGHVYTVWGYVKECASKASPRGCVLDFDALALADFTGWPVALIEATMVAFRERGMIDDGFISDWLSKQPVKLDATNAKRQAKHRERVKAQRAAPAPAKVTDSNGRYSVTGKDVTGVTTTEEKEQSNCSFSDSSEQASDTSLKSDTPRNVREQARVFINAGDIWAWIAGEGLPSNIGTRAFNRQRVTDWLSRGLTDRQMDEAMERARKRRKEERSTHPINLGFLACFVDEVISGAPSKPTNGGGYERGDELSREFARARS